jgi:hypothetical protein
MRKTHIPICAFVCGLVLFAVPSCVLVPKPKNEYAHLKGKVVRLKHDGSLYKSDSTITHASDPYVIAGANQFPDLKSIYIPAGTEMHIDEMKHLRVPSIADYWYASGRVYIRGKVYHCAFDQHHSYLELK